MQLLVNVIDTSVVTNTLFPWLNAATNKAKQCPFGISGSIFDVYEKWDGSKIITGDEENKSGPCKSYLLACKMAVIRAKFGHIMAVIQSRLNAIFTDPRFAHALLSEFY